MSDAKIKLNLKILGIIIAIIIASLTLVAVFYFSKSSYKSSSESLQTQFIDLRNLDKNTSILFWGATCPHCKNLFQILKERPELESKLNIIKLEVYFNETNAKLLFEAAKICGLREDSVGVPFLYHNGKCILGDLPIVNYLESL
ncbi:MAG: hypothetical protein QW197_02940 [Candidatus Aenigmatarchaeota archaeon]